MFYKIIWLWGKLRDFSEFIKKKNCHFSQMKITSIARKFDVTRGKHARDNFLSWNFQSSLTSIMFTRCAVPNYPREWHDDTFI